MTPRFTVTLTDNLRGREMTFGDEDINKLNKKRLANLPLPFDSAIRRMKEDIESDKPDTKTRKKS